MVRPQAVLPLLLLAGLASCAGAKRGASGPKTSADPRIGDAMLAERMKRRDAGAAPATPSVVARRTKLRDAKIDGRLESGLRLEELGGGARAAFTYDDEALHAFFRWESADSHRLNIAFPD